LIVLDASGLLAAFAADQRQHEAALRALSDAGRPLLLSPFVAAEVDYLLASRIGVHAEMIFLEDVARGAYSLEPFGATDMMVAIELLERYAGLNIGLADASIVVLAQRHGTADILTLDERHFRALRDSSGRPFRLLPLDGS
jgi:predicted nucleic acid-binding protein